MRAVVKGWRDWAGVAREAKRIFGFWAEIRVMVGFGAGAWPRAGSLALYRRRPRCMGRTGALPGTHSGTGGPGWRHAGADILLGRFFCPLVFFSRLPAQRVATGRLYPCCNRPRVSRVLAAFGFAGQRSGGGRWARADVAWIFLFVFFLLFLVGFRRACGPESRGERWQALYLAVRYCVSMCAYRLANSRPHVVFSLYF